MKKIICSCFLFAVVGFGPFTQANKVFAQTEQTQKNGFITHIVTSGETVFSLSKRYNLTMQDIYDYNPEAKQGIKGGQKLQIPVKTQDISVNDRGVVSPYLEYRVTKGETIFSISRQHEISEETLINLNPELKDGLKEGMVLRIPRKQIQPVREKPRELEKVFKQGENTTQAVAVLPHSINGQDREHLVVQGETLYGISKSYGVGIDALYAKNPNLLDGLKTGMTLIIPLGNSIRTMSTVNSTDNVVRVGILFPFLDNQATVQKERLVEFYEGFLLAVREMKEDGINIEVSTFDTGLEKDIKRLVSILGTSELRDLDVLIGGTSQQQIDVLTDFSQKMGVRYIIPFGGIKQNTIQGKKNTYQYVNPLSNLFSPIAKAFAQKFGSSNIIFVEELDSDNNKKGFVTELKKELKNSGIGYKELRENVSLGNELNLVASKSLNNIIIPTSASEGSLQRIMRAIDNSGGDLRFGFFGYPEWQTYSNMYNSLHKYGAYIYSTFYLDEGDIKVQSMISQYRKWYNKSVSWSFPRYTLLGYDMGLFFIQGINRKKANFDEEVSSLRIPTLQSAIHFERHDRESGFVNTGFYFVRFKQDSSIEKTEYR